MKQQQIITPGNGGAAPWQVPREFRRYYDVPQLRPARPKLDGYIALDDGTFVRDWRVILPPGTMRPKSWAVNTISGGPSTGAIGTNQLGFNLVNVDVGDSIALGTIFATTSTAPTISSITCASESNLTLVGSAYQVTTWPFSVKNSMQFAYLNVTTGSGTKAINITYSHDTVGGCVAFAIAFAGSDTAGFYDTGSLATGSATSTTPSVSVTTSQSNDCILAMIAAESTDPTEDTGYTLISLTNAVFNDAAQYNLNVGAAGAKTVVFDAFSSQLWQMCAAGFKSADGAAGGGKPTGYYNAMMMGQ